jgi:hypothetical protein
MKNIYEVLREKEMDLARLRTEVEALRFVVPLLAERSDEQSTPGTDLVWAATVPERNKWPLNLSKPAPAYLDS